MRQGSPIVKTEKLALDVPCADETTEVNSLAYNRDETMLYSIDDE